MSAARFQDPALRRPGGRVQDRSAGQHRSGLRNRRTRHHRAGLYVFAIADGLAADRNRRWRYAGGTDRHRIAPRNADESEEIRQDRPNPLEIISHALVAAAEEMSVTVWRTSRSTTVRELLGLLHRRLRPKGRNIAQAARMPVHLNSMELCLQEILARQSLLRIGATAM